MAPSIYLYFQITPFLLVIAPSVHSYVITKYLYIIRFVSWNTPKASKKFQAKIEYHERIAKEKETRAENGQSDPVAT
jgi:hypothetical protein